MHKRITHYRIPLSDYKGQVRGKPTPRDLHLYRRGEGFTFGGGEPTSRGGLSICDIIVEDKIIATGFAKCSYADNFNYRLGRLIATGRAEDIIENRA